MYGSVRTSQCQAILVSLFFNATFPYAIPIKPTAPSGHVRPIDTQTHIHRCSPRHFRHGSRQLAVDLTKRGPST